MLFVIPKDELCYCYEMRPDKNLHIISRKQQQKSRMPVAMGTIIPTECWTAPTFWSSTLNSFLEIILQ